MSIENHFFYLLNSDKLVQTNDQTLQIQGFAIMKKRILLTGTTGMIGGIILSQCLENENISQIISLVRKPTGRKHEKLMELIIDDFLNLESADEHLKSIDIVYYCLGVYTGAVDRELFRTITIDYPEVLAKALLPDNPDLTFCLLSGAGADRTEKSRFMFAKDKGIIENRLSKMGFKAFHAFRPGYIYPVTPRNEPNLSYRIMRFFYPLLKLLGKGASITSEQLANSIFNAGIHGCDHEILENKAIINLHQQFAASKQL